MPHSLYCYAVYKNVVLELKLMDRHDLPLYVYKCFAEYLPPRAKVKNE